MEPTERLDNGARECHWCATPFSSGYKGGSGYGIESNTGHRYCYLCCGVKDALQMERGEPIVLYLAKTDNGYVVSNWPKTLVFANPYVRKGSHNIARTRYDAWFWFRGVQWHGVNYGEHSQILYCKPTKQRKG